MGHFDAGLFVWSLATFAVLLGLLARFAFRPLADALKKREDVIRGALEDAERAREEAREILDLNAAQLDKAKSEARDVIDEGHHIVAEMKKESARQAKEEADLIVERAREEINRETQKSLDDLKGTVASLSTRIAHQIIRENLDEERHDELAEAFIERLKKSRNATRKP